MTGRRPPFPCMLRIPVCRLPRSISMYLCMPQPPRLRTLKPQWAKGVALSNYVVGPSRPLRPCPPRPIRSLRIRLWIWARLPRKLAMFAWRSSFTVIARVFRRTIEGDIVAMPIRLRRMRQIRRPATNPRKMWLRMPNVVLVAADIEIAVWLVGAILGYAERLWQGNENEGLVAITFFPRKHGRAPRYHRLLLGTGLFFARFAFP